MKTFKIVAKTIDTLQALQSVLVAHGYLFEINPHEIHLIKPEMSLVFGTTSYQSDNGLARYLEVLSKHGNFGDMEIFRSSKDGLFMDPLYGHMVGNEYTDKELAVLREFYKESVSNCGQCTSEDNMSYCNAKDLSTALNMDLQVIGGIMSSLQAKGAISDTGESARGAKINDFTLVDWMLMGSLADKEQAASFAQQQAAQKEEVKEEPKPTGLTEEQKLEVQQIMFGCTYAQIEEEVKSRIIPCYNDMADVYTIEAQNIIQRAMLLVEGQPEYAKERFAEANRMLNRARYCISRNKEVFGKPFIGIN